MAGRIPTTESGRFAALERNAPRLAIAMAAFLLIAGFAIVLLGAKDYREQEVAAGEIQARILASAVSAALAFDDRRGGQEYVNALEANANVLVAAVYDATGKPFVAYARSPDVPSPTQAPAMGSEIVESRLGVAIPVEQSGTRLGSVYVQLLIEPASRRLLRYGLIALLLLLTALIVAVLGFSQRALAKVNAELERRATELAHSNEKLQIQVEHREKAEAALRHSQKMEAIGQLTGGVAHDFNNLLQIILVSLETLRRRASTWNLATGEAHDLNRLIDTSIKGGERAAALIRQLLAFSRRQPLTLKTVDLNALVSGMSDLLRRTLGESIGIEVALAGGLWKVRSDANQLESVILNLAVNARDAMPDGGKLSIATANLDIAGPEFDETPVREGEDITPGQYVAVSVADTGTGMSRETLAKVFEPFFTTKDIGRGTGLGLSQVYGFLKQSGGHIRIASELGRGTTVIVYLPRDYAADERDETPLQDASPPAATASETILVVEDEVVVRMASLDMLRELGYRVEEAADGRQALQVLARKPGIALLFSDIGLPGGLNGKQLADEARKLRPDLGVLLTTGYARDAINPTAESDLDYAVIAKPFTYENLAARLREILEVRAK